MKENKSAKEVLREVRKILGVAENEDITSFCKRLKEEIPLVAKLHPQELWVIKRWRTKYRYGRITVIMQDGIPQRIELGIINDDPRDDKK